VLNKPKAPFDPKLINHDRLLFGGHYSSGQFSPDGQLLAVVTSDAPETIQLVDAAAGGEVRRIKLDAKLVRLAFSPDGALIAATERDSAVRMYEVATAKRVWVRKFELNNPYENYTSAIAFTPDGKTIAVCATDNRIHLLDAKSGKEAAALVGHTWYPWNLAFTADGNVLYSAGWDGPVRRWDVAKREQIDLPGVVRATGVTGMSPDGELIAYEDDSGRVHLVQRSEQKEIQTFGFPDSQYSQLTFSPDSGHLAGGGTRGENVHIAIWQLATGKLEHEWNWPKGRDPHSDIEALRFSPDGKKLAAAVFRQSKAYWWEIANEKQIAQPSHEEIYGLSFSPDGNTLATVGWDSVVRLWEADSGKLRHELNLKAKNNDDLRMYSVSYSTHGGLLTTQHMNGELWIWDAKTMKVRAKVDAGMNFGAMCFSPDGLWVATGSRNGDIALWDALTAEKVLDVGIHQDSVDTLCFGNDNGVLLSGGGDGVCYLWDLRPKGDATDDLDKLWSDLSGDNVYASYRAICSLEADANRSAPFLAEKLRRVTQLMDPDGVERGLSDQDKTRRQRLQRLLVDRDPKLERQATAQRAIQILASFDTPLADKSLHELADHDPNGDVGALATAALKESQPEPTK
jgi:WD40 repeat protein